MSSKEKFSLFGKSGDTNKPPTTTPTPVNNPPKQSDNTGNGNPPQGPKAPA